MRREAGESVIVRGEAGERERGEEDVCNMYIHSG